MTEEMSLEERKVIYRARRGLKEIDVYFDPYVKNYYLQADPVNRKIQICWIGLWKSLSRHALK